MAIIYDHEINKHTDWDGDESTFGKPVSGRAVLKFIKDSLNSKIGFIYEDTRRGKFYGFADREDYLEYLETLNPELIISKWNNETLEQGIRIYTLSEVDALENADPEKYITIPDPTDLDKPVENKTYDTSINGPLANILFSAIRQLQSEIAKIKNTFDYGMYSYTGTNTAMSRVEHGYIEDIEDEPLWAIEEDGSLSFLTEISTDTLHGITPLDNVFVENQTLRIEGLGIWEILQELGDDPKLLIYLTTTGKNISFNLVDEEENTFILNLNELNIPAVNIYNILVIISRKKLEHGNNYIWISIGDFNSNNNTLLSGYYKNGELVPFLNTLDSSYNLQGITFNDLTLNKCTIYSKYQDFSREVIPSKPTDNNYSYKVAHITIRSVDSYNTLDSIKDLLPENELIFIENTKKLYIKNNYRLISIGGNGQQEEPIDDGMTREEIIQLLEELGIVSLDNGQLSINSLSDITFIHEDSGTEFKLTIDSEGNLHTTKIENETLSNIILNTFGTDSIGSEDNIRGFVGRLRKAQRNKEVRGTSIKEYVETDNIGLCSDRIKIGAFYAPALNNKSFGCSHCFIELENTSDRDFPLEGCYIHLARNNSNNLPIVSHLALTGTIPAGGTYLIRGAKKAEFDDPNTFIKVTTFDLEWWENGQLLDFSHNGEVDELLNGGIISFVGNDPHGICLTYGKKDLEAMETVSSANEDATLKKADYIYKNYYIDSIYYNNAYKSGTSYPWAAGKEVLMAYISSTSKTFPDCIYRNTFELDPANLAYQALNTYDSSRCRHQTTNDYQYLELSKEFIEFPKTSEKYPISKFTPKASFEHKNVCTDKTGLNINKPNNVTCSFGKNPYTTRCFNWVSGGVFDEYVWIKEGSSWIRFESYKEGDENNIQESGRLKRKEFNNKNIIDCIYKRIIGKFPAANTIYTSHKCIINIEESPVNDPTTYTYIVGRADKNGNPDLEHCSEEYTFTLYPTSYVPRIYQTTDQQGFHWVEYQSWGAAAEYINTRINNETSSENIIPVLVNTGDMTLSGARVNEWIDYYTAGKSLFNHLEQMNVVGNNDLCGNDLTILGTGDDAGKANSYYFHVFYCYEVETEEGMIPIVNNKYVPSLYRIIFNDYILLFVNSEITANNCIGWFNKSFIDTAGKTCPINIYTGWEVPTEGEAHYDGSFTSIYTMIYNMTDINNKEIIALCHEMPFTVITLENLYPQSDITPKYRNVSGTSLVGSHLNLLNPNDKVGIYWFSRLLEYRGCKLCIGGHKHTYAITYPLMENYLYGNGQSSLHDGPMSMSDTLENDSVIWITKNTGDYLVVDNLPDWDVNLSKFPLTKRANPTGDPGYTFYPSKNISPETGFVNGNSGIIYFMCLATGFKLMSNKELPSPKQTFSQFLPNSTLEFNNDGTVKSSKASLEQRYPMFAIIDLDSNINIKLIRLKNILNRPQDLFTQITYGKSSIVPLYLVSSNPNNLNEWQYGVWSDTEENLLSNI